MKRLAAAAAVVAMLEAALLFKLRLCTQNIINVQN